MMVIERELPMDSYRPVYREYFDGISLLKILSMFFVVILHILLQGGILKNAEGASLQGAWFLETGVFCAVNIYALISGFLGYREDDERPYRYSRFVELWFTTVFYNVLLTLFFYAIHSHDMGGIEILRAFFPLTNNAYWYFTSYFGVVLTAPLIHYVVRSLSGASLIRCSAALILFFSLYGAFASHRSDVFGLYYGYSFLWLALLYFLGAVIRSTELYRMIRSSSAFLGILVSWVILFLYNLLMQHFEEKTAMYAHDGFYFSYLSPAVLMMAVCYLFLFSNIRMSGTARILVYSFSPCSFGVYLLHANPQVLKWFIANRFVRFADFSFPLLILSVLCTAFVILVIGLMADTARRVLFDKLDVQALAVRIETAVRHLVIRLSSRILRG